MDWITGLVIIIELGNQNYYTCAIMTHNNWVHVQNRGRVTQIWANNKDERKNTERGCQTVPHTKLIQYPILYQNNALRRVAEGVGDI